MHATTAPRLSFKTDNAPAYRAAACAALAEGASVLQAHRAALAAEERERRADYCVSWTSAATGNHRASAHRTAASARREAAALVREGARNVALSHFDRATHCARLLAL